VVKGRNGTEGSIIVHEFVLSFHTLRRGFESPTAHGFITKFIVNIVVYGHRPSVMTSRWPMIMDIELHNRNDTSLMGITEDTDGKGVT
jgi:hypothetical protein